MTRLLNTLTILLLVVYTSCTGPVKAAGVTVDTSRTIVVSGEINDGKAVAAVKQLTKLTKKSKKPIYLYIDSPGGGVTAGLYFIHNMEKAKAQGIKFICVVDSIAASMAFQYLTHCDTRYAHKFSGMLWHPVRIGLMFITLTPDLAKQLHQDLSYVEEALVPVLLKELAIDEKVFYKHYHAESLHYGHQLKKLAPGYLELIDGVTNSNKLRDHVDAEIKKQRKIKKRFQLLGPSHLDYTYRQDKQGE